MIATTSGAGLLSGLLSGIGNSIVSWVASIIASIVGAINAALAQLVGWIIGGIVTATNNDDPLTNLAHMSLGSYVHMLALPAGVLAAVVLVIAVADAALKGSPSEVAKRAFGAPLAAAVLAGGYEAFVELLVRFVDWTTSLVSTALFTAGPHWSQVFSNTSLLGIAGSIEQSIGQLIMLAIMIPAALVILLELLVRALLVVLAVVLFPMFLGAIIWPTTRRWLVGIGEKVIAIVFSKLIMVILLGLVGYLDVKLASTGAAGMITLLPAAGLVIAAFSLPMALRLVPLTIAAAESHGVAKSVAASTARSVASGFGDAETGAMLSGGASLATAGVAGAAATGGASLALAAATSVAKQDGATRAMAESALDEPEPDNTSAAGAATPSAGGAATPSAGGGVRSPQRRSKTTTQANVGAMARGAHGGIGYIVGRHLGEQHLQRANASQTAPQSTSPVEDPVVSDVPGSPQSEREPDVPPAYVHSLTNIDAPVSPPPAAQPIHAAPNAGPPPASPAPASPPPAAQPIHAAPSAGPPPASPAPASPPPVAQPIHAAPSAGPPPASPAPASPPPVAQPIHAAPSAGPPPASPAPAAPEQSPFAQFAQDSVAQPPPAAPEQSPFAQFLSPPDIPEGEPNNA
ncbi:MAG: hypothetical protein ACYCS4_12970 [Acidimicrobiales bacterium]